MVSRLIKWSSGIDMIEWEEGSIIGFPNKHILRMELHDILEEVNYKQKRHGYPYPGTTIIVNSNVLYRNSANTAWVKGDVLTNFLILPLSSVSIELL